MYSNAVIEPQYNGSSTRDPSVQPDTDKYAMTPDECAKLALGMKFKLGSGVEVNSTYDAWTKNLYYLMRAGHISQQMKDGLIKLNYFKRSPTESSEPDDKDKTRPNIHYGCYWPPYTA